MKKKLSVLLLLIVLVSALIACVACSHTHLYLTTVTQPTCTERGYTTYECSCGDKYVSDYIDTIPHTPKSAEYENVVTADCTHAGSYDEIVRCKDCNAVISSTHHDVEQADHTPKQAEHENIVDATCSTLGSYNEVIRCNDCNEILSSTPKIIDKLPHTPQAAQRENVVDATCTSQGSYDEVVRCKDCNAVISSTPKTIDKLPHTPKTAQMENVVNATCVNAGSYDEVVRCDVCDEVLSSVHHDGVTLPHTPKDEPARENETPATCTTLGSYDEVIRCKDCNTVISSTPKTIAMLDHTPKSATQEDVVNSTCSTLGSYNEVVRCKDCNAIITSTPKTIDKLPHTPSNAVTENSVPSTCTSQGSYDSVVYCAVCSEQISVTHNTVAKLPHNYDYGTCKDCGYKIEDEAQFTADGFDIDYTTQPATVSCTVNNATSNIDLVRAFNLQNGSTWKLYSDFEGNYEYKLKAMSLGYGHNTAYIIVYYDKDSDYFTRYKLDIYRLSIRNYTFADFNGNVLSVGTVEENSTVSAPASDPTRDYYDFDCWTFDGKQVAFPYIVTDDITFTAKYLPTTYNITYVVNGGTFTTNVNDYDIERAVTFDMPTKQYYDFAGWYDNAELNGNALTGIPVGSHDNKTFYAKYTPTVYGITYVLNGGTLTTEVNDYDIDRAVTFDIPQKTGHDFAGWYDNAELNGNALTGIPIGNHDNKTFYAKWTLITYSITYHLNGGTLTTEVNDYDIERAVTFDIPTKQYYDFAGWYDNAELNGDTYEGLTIGNYNDKTFYAKYTPTVYGITYELNGGTLTTEVNDYDIERAVTFGIPQKLGYTFAGWYDNIDFNGNEVKGITVGNYGNKIVYAKWTIIVYTVTRQLNGGTMQIEDETFTVEDLPYTPNPATPCKDNCIFDGWYKDASFTESDITVTSIGNTSIYAKWIDSRNFFKYSLSGSTYTITGYTGSYTDIAIPKTYNSKPITTIGSEAFFSCSSLTSITIPDSVTSIGSSAFGGCNGLENVVIGNSVTSIGYYAFSGCSNLTSVTIGNGVTSINSDAFEDCSSLTRVYYTGDIAGWCNISFGGPTANPLCYAHNLYIDNELVTGNLVIPDTVTEIKPYAFYNCTSITSVVIPDSVTSIGYYAFSDCSSLTKVNYLGTIADWCNISFGGNYANPLYYAHNLYINNEIITGDIVIPSGVTKIPAYTFKNSAITSVIIPDSVTSIGYYAFYNCSNLTSVYYTGDIAGWCKISFGNDYANPLYYAHNLYIDNKLVTELVIPDTVTEIKNFAFNGCTSITSVVIPDSVTSIGYYAFSGCSNLTSVVIGNGVTSIGYDAFYNCSRLTSIVIPNSVTSIGPNAFRNCSKLTSVTIGNSVTTIGSYAFSYCSSLKTVYYTGTADDWEKISIGGSNTALTSATRYYNYGGEEHTYVFETNGGNEIESITAIDLINLPTPIKEGWYFGGWYDNAELSGNPVAMSYYNSNNTTLYAKWLTEEEYYDGSSFERAKTAVSGQTYNVDIITGGQLYYFAFTATEDGTLTVYSNGSNDTYGYLYSSTQSQLKTDDDSGDSRNFKITYTVTAGQTYYVAVKLYSSSNTGSFTVTFK